jgi:hypothetical protein
VGAGVLALALTAHAQTLPLPPNFPRDAIKTYCAAAVDMPMPAIFGDGRHGSPFAWRCVNGRAYTCLEGADGVACSSRSRSRVPLASMVDACREGDNLSVASGAYGFVWDWECRGGKPVIAGALFRLDLQTNTRSPVKFDAQGYAEDEWHALTEARQ